MGTLNGTRVLLVLESWGDGGTEAYVGQLGPWLGRRGWEPALCVLGGAPADIGERVGGWARGVHVLGARGAVARAAGLRRVLRRERPAVCHLHLYSSLLPAALAARAVPGARVVTMLHMPLWQWSRRHRTAWRLALAASHAVTGNSRAVLSSVGRWPPPAGTWLTPAPLPADLPRVERPRGGGGEGPFTIAGAGRLAREKDWATLIRATALLRERAGGQRTGVGVDVRLRIRGEGPLREGLTALARGLGVPLELPGTVERATLLRELGAADAFVLPSRFEGLGMAAIEAMALAVPTVTADFEASADYVEDGVTGWRFPRGDAAALADVLERVLADPAGARRVAEAGRALVLERFDEDAAFAGFEGAYAGVAGEAGDARHSDWPLAGADTPSARR